MTNPILQKVADALRQANEELHAILKFNVLDHTWEVWVDNKPAHVNFMSYDLAEDKCEELNYLYAARKAVESLRDLFKHISGPIGNRDHHNNFNKALDIITNDLHS